jgi:hypothetical protein
LHLTYVAVDERIRNGMQKDKHPNFLAVCEVNEVNYIFLESFERGRLMNLHGKDIKVFSGNSNRELAQEIVREDRLPLVSTPRRKFSMEKPQLI